MLVQFPHDVEDLLHQDGSQAHGGLIQHEQAGLGHQGPAHGQHLLLAAGQGAGHLVLPLLQAGEALIHVGDTLVILVGGAGERAHLQIFLHGHLQEDLPPLGDQGQAHGHDLVGGDAPQALAHELDGAGVGGQQSGHRLQDGGLTRAVGPDEGDYLPLVDLEGDALDGVDGSVIDVDVVHLQNGVHPLLPSFFWLPR